MTTIDRATAQTLSPVAMKDESETSELLALMYAYDQRGGGIETANKDDTQGIGLGKRNKKRFEAQQMVVWLGTLAHNILVWARDWLKEKAPIVGRLGLKRLVRDVLQVNGMIEQDQDGRVVRIVLNQAHFYAGRLEGTLQALLRSTQIVVTLGET